MPFIAPALPFILGGASAAGAIAKGRASGRADQANANATQDQLRILADKNALDAAQFNRDAPVVRGHQATYGDVLSGVQPSGFTGSGRDLRVTGGLNPNLLSPESRQLGVEIRQNATNVPSGPQAVPRGAAGPQDGRRAALLKALGSDQASGSPDFTAGGFGFHPKFTEPTPLPHAGLLDKILGGIGIGGDALGLLKEYGTFDSNGNAPDSWGSPNTWGGS